MAFKFVIKRFFLSFKTIFRKRTKYCNDQEGAIKSPNILGSRYKHRKNVTLVELSVLPNSLCDHKAGVGLKNLFCVQSKGLSVTEIYFRLEGLDVTISFCFILMGKRIKYVCMSKMHNFLFFPPEKKMERQIF